jgi:hypothetical protein
MSTDIAVVVVVVIEYEIIMKTLAMAMPTDIACWQWLCQQILRRA